MENAKQGVHHEDVPETKPLLPVAKEETGDSNGDLTGKDSFTTADLPEENPLSSQQFNHGAPMNGAKDKVLPNNNEEEDDEGGEVEDENKEEVEGEEEEKRQQPLQEETLTATKVQVPDIESILHTYSSLESDLDKVSAGNQLPEKLSSVVPKDIAEISEERDKSPPADQSGNRLTNGDVENGETHVDKDACANQSQEITTGGEGVINTEDENDGGGDDDDVEAAEGTDKAALPLNEIENNLKDNENISETDETTKIAAESQENLTGGVGDNSIEGGEEDEEETDLVITGEEELREKNLRNGIGPGNDVKTEGTGDSSQHILLQQSNENISSNCKEKSTEAEETGKVLPGDDDSLETVTSDGKTAEKISETPLEKQSEDMGETLPEKQESEDTSAKKLSEEMGETLPEKPESEETAAEKQSEKLDEIIPEKQLEEMAETTAEKQPEELGKPSPEYQSEEMSEIPPEKQPEEISETQPEKHPEDGSTCNENLADSEDVCKKDQSQENTTISCKEESTQAEEMTKIPPEDQSREEEEQTKEKEDESTKGIAEASDDKGESGDQLQEHTTDGDKIIGAETAQEILQSSASLTGTEGEKVEEPDADMQLEKTAVEESLSPKSIEESEIVAEKAVDAINGESGGESQMNTDDKKTDSVKETTAEENLPNVTKEEVLETLPDQGDEEPDAKAQDESEAVEAVTNGSLASEKSIDTVEKTAEDDAKINDQELPNQIVQLEAALQADNAGESETADDVANEKMMPEGNEGLEEHGSKDSDDISNDLEDTHDVLDGIAVEEKSIVTEALPVSEEGKTDDKSSDEIEILEDEKSDGLIVELKMKEKEIPITLERKSVTGRELAAAGEDQMVADQGSVEVEVMVSDEEEEEGGEEEVAEEDQADGNDRVESESVGEALILDKDDILPPVPTADAKDDKKPEELLEPTKRRSSSLKEQFKMETTCEADDEGEDEEEELVAKKVSVDAMKSPVVSRDGTPQPQEEITSEQQIEPSTPHLQEAVVSEEVVEDDSCDVTATDQVPIAEEEVNQLTRVSKETAGKKSPELAAQEEAEVVEVLVRLESEETIKSEGKEEENALDSEELARNIIKTSIESAEEVLVQEKVKEFEAIATPAVPVEKAPPSPQRESEDKAEPLVHIPSEPKAEQLARAKRASRVASEKKGMKLPVKARSPMGTRVPMARDRSLGKKEADNDSGVDETTQAKVESCNKPTTQLNLKGAKKRQQVTTTPTAATSPTKFYTPHLLSPTKSVTSPTKPMASARGAISPGGSKGTPTKTTPTGDTKKLPMNKVVVGLTPSPNLREVKSKIGSMQNIQHRPGGGSVKVESKHLDFTQAKSKVGSVTNITHKPGGGDKKIISKKLEWNAGSKVGSLNNAHHKPGGGEKKIETMKLDFKDRAKSKVGSTANIKHEAGGGKIQIEDHKLQFKESAKSKVGSLDNVTHKPGGGNVQIFDEAVAKNRPKSSATSDGQLSGGQSPRSVSPQPPQNGLTPTEPEVIHEDNSVDVKVM